MEKLIERLQYLLDEEIEYLDNALSFVLDLPSFITNNTKDYGDLNSFLQEHELRSSHYLNEKSFILDELARVLEVPRKKVNFNFLYKMGYGNLKEYNERIKTLSNNLKREFLKINIFLRKFNFINKKFLDFYNGMGLRNYNLNGRTESLNNSSTISMEV